MVTFSGIWPALITPFDDKNRPDLGKTRELVDHLLELGVNGFYVCGSTGEGIYMSLAERQQVAETVLTQVNGRVPVIVHVGAMALVDVIALSRHAKDHGAQAISSIIPPKFDALQSVSAYYGQIATSLPDMPLLTYILNPSIDTISLMNSLLQYPNVVGVKYTGADMNEFHQVIELGKGRDWTVFAGMDEHSIYGAMAGSSGHIGSTINLMPEAFQKIRQYVLSGEHQKANQLQERVNAVINTLYGTGNFFGALKFAMRSRGVDCGNPRLPVMPLTETQQQTIIEYLHRDVLAGL